MKCQNYNINRTVERENLNLNPLQRGGILTTAAREALFEFGDGYSVCDYCAGRLNEVSKPNVSSFLDDLSDFINVEVTRTVHGAREGKFAIMHGICKKGDNIIVDGNAHYTTHLAAERNSLNMVEVPNNGADEFKISPEKYKETLENGLDEGKDFKLAVLTHVDGDYANLTDAKKIAKVCSDNNVPILLNCAYSMGRLPVDAKDLGVDFVVGSGHKSMAASGPIGVVGTSEEWAKKIFARSKLHENKEIELLGCTSRGAPLATLMASLPYVVERVKKWDDEVANARYFVQEMEKIEGVRQVGVRPKNHDLIRFDTPKFNEIANDHPRKGFFLYEELKKRHIVGIKRGQTEWFKCSLYGMSKEQIDYVANSFKEIVSEN